MKEEPARKNSVKKEPSESQTILELNYFKTEYSKLYNLYQINHEEKSKLEDEKIVLKESLTKAEAEIKQINSKKKVLIRNLRKSA